MENEPSYQWDISLNPQDPNGSSSLEDNSSRGWAKKSRQTFCFIAQKQLTLESKVKLELKTMGQDL